MTIRKTSSKLLAALLLAALLLLALPPAARAAATLNLDLVDPDDVAESVIRLDPDLGTTPLPDGSYLIVYYGTGPLTISGQGDYTVQVAAAIDTVILEDGAVFGDGSDDALSLYNENTTLTGEGSGIILNGGIYAAENLTVAGSIDEINSLFVGIIANGNINITGSIGNIYAVDSGILSSSGNITVSSTGSVGDITGRDGYGIHAAVGNIEIHGHIESISGGAGQFSAPNGDVIITGTIGSAPAAPKSKSPAPAPVVAILTDIQKSGDTFTFTTYIANASGNMAGATVTVQLNDKYSTTVTIGQDGIGYGTLEAPGFSGDTAIFSARPGVSGGAAVSTPYRIYSMGEVVRR